jgi:hypothetical protein
MSEEPNIDNLIAAFYDLETSIHFDERQALPSVATEILSTLVGENLLTDKNRELVDNICISDLFPEDYKAAGSIPAALHLMELGLKFGVAHWQQIAALFLPAGDLVNEYLTRSGQLYKIMSPERICAGTEPSPWVYDLRRLRNIFATGDRPDGSSEQSWQDLLTKALESPLTFGELLSKRKNLLKSDPATKLRIWLLAVVIGFESERISIQSPVNVIRNHINKRSDDFQTVLLANLAEAIFRISDSSDLRLITEITSVTGDIRRLRRLDDLYLCIAALNRVLPARYKGMIDAMSRAESQVWTNPHEGFLPTTLVTLIGFSNTDLKRSKAGAPRANKVIFGLHLVAMQFKIAFNMQISRKSTESMWESLATVLDQTPPEISGIMQKFVQFGFESVLPPPVMDAVRRNYRLMHNFKDIDPQPSVEKFNDTKGPVRIASVVKVPFALGSIGQLFAAEATDGRKLTIKIKKPGIERLFREQIKKARRLRYFFHTLNQSLPYDKVLTAIEGIWLDECDYELEHESHAAIARIFAGHPRIKVPALHSGRNQQYLVADRVIGGSFTAFAARASQEEKNDIARLIVESVFVQMTSGKFNYDIHPGNYLIDQDRNLHLIDFGGILDADLLGNTSPLQIMRLIEQNDIEGLRKFLVVSGFYTAEHVENIDEKLSIFRDVYFKPFFTDADLVLNEKYAKDIVFSQFEREIKSGKATCTTDKSLTVLRFYWSFYHLIAMLTPSLNFYRLLRSLEHNGRRIFP